MIRALLLAAAVASDTGGPGDAWIGRDKVKHFVLSAFVHSFSYSVVRAASDRRVAGIAAGTAVVGAAVMKELRDRRAGRSFSVRDVAWGLAGGAAAAALMNGTR